MSNRHHNWCGDRRGYLGRFPSNRFRLSVFIAESEGEAPRMKRSWLLPVLPGKKQRREKDKNNRYGIVVPLRFIEIGYIDSTAQLKSSTSTSTSTSSYLPTSLRISFSYESSLLARANTFCPGTLNILHCKKR